MGQVYRRIQQEEFRYYKVIRKISCDSLERVGATSRVTTCISRASSRRGEDYFLNNKESCSARPKSIR